MKNRSIYSVQADGEVPGVYQENLRSKLEKESDFADFLKLHTSIRKFMLSDGEPDFESFKTKAYQSLQTEIRRRCIRVRAINPLQRSIKTVWAAVAVFAALAGGWVLGRTTSGVVQTASGPTTEAIVFTLPADFDLQPAGTPEMVQLSGFRRAP